MVAFLEAGSNLVGQIRFGGGGFQTSLSEFLDQFFFFFFLGGGGERLID